MSPSISDEELNGRILTLDNELIDQGFEPWQRQIHIESKLSQELQISYIISGDNQPHHVKLLRQHFDAYYRKEDLFMPPLHVGAFLFLDLFFPIRIPVIFGSPVIDLRQFLCQATESQTQLIFGKRTSTLTFCDQAFDLLDFVYGLDDLGHHEKSALPRPLANADAGQDMSLNRCFQGKPVFFVVPFRQAGSNQPKDY